MKLKIIIDNNPIIFGYRYYHYYSPNQNTFVLPSFIIDTEGGFTKEELDNLYAAVISKSDD